MRRGGWLGRLRCCGACAVSLWRELVWSSVGVGFVSLSFSVLRTSSTKKMVVMAARSETPDMTMLGSK